MALLSLPGYLRAQAADVNLLQGDFGDPLAPQTYVYSGGFFEGWGKVGIELKAGEAQLEQGVALTGFDLGREHASGSPPSLAPLGFGVEDSDAPSGSGELAGTGGADGTSAHDDNVCGIRHLGG
jgi:hypothetical protein